MRQGSGIVATNVEARRSDIVRAILRFSGGHHSGRDSRCPAYPGNQVLASLPDNVRIVSLDVCKVHWCSVCGVAIHSLAWPRIARAAKVIRRTLFTNHCSWADVLVVHSRCSCCHGSNRVLERLLWHWAKLRMSFVVCKEARAETRRGDRVPELLRKCYCQS